MKEQTLIEMKNKIETLGMINQKVIRELNQLTTIALGTLEAIKYMPGYDEAIEKLKEKAGEEKVEDKKLEL
jgi:peptidyl-tRNA hydrolase